MPLKKGKSNKVRQENIEELHKSNPKRPIKQDIAIAYDVQRRSKGKKHHGFE